MIFTDYFIKRSIRKMARTTASRPHCFRSLEEAAHILVFCEAQDEKEITPCLTKLRSLGKKVQVCLYVPVSHSDMNTKEVRLLVFEKDHSRWGFPDPESVRALNAEKADILIDMTGDNYIQMKYLMLQHSSTFKIGLKRAGQLDMYDFCISMADNDRPARMFDLIIYYLQTIRGGQKGVK
ncbi:hypothetical protein Barb4_01481 [Bacteroidales bacterium Barb4]|nr:hypothetical protein Barb4_01481 [Bacteroidales bacterium Barb4]